MMAFNRVYLLVLSGEVERAREVVGPLYPDCEVVEVAKRTLREQGWRGQIRELRRLQGRALVYFAASSDAFVEPQLFSCTGLVHRCRETVLADGEGNCRRFQRRDWLWMIPQAALSAASDLAFLVVSRLLLRLWKPHARRVTGSPSGGFLAYLHPYPLDAGTAGGAMSHVRGFLSGLRSSGVACQVVAGRELPDLPYPVEVVRLRRRFFLVREAVMLAYNLTFARAAYGPLRRSKPAALYQRHGRFVVAGSLLSRWLSIPLVLEYNGSEIWMADHWDPARFRGWMRDCEDVSLASASQIVVVSQTLKEELLNRGVSADRVLVNPNGADPERFRPGCGGNAVRARLGLPPEALLVTFVGTFSYWHGVKVLQEAIQRLLEEPLPGPPLYFLTLGDGPLRLEMLRDLAPHLRSGRVLAPGTIPHEEVPRYLDASDIMVSPHVPMPDGRPFFGSPTKLFEYMAMAKAIVASDLDQIGQVLVHDQSAWLVRPGAPEELAAAVRLLAEHEALRQRLGAGARDTFLAKFTWEHNAARVWERIGSAKQAMGIEAPEHPAAFQEK